MRCRVHGFHLFAVLALLPVPGAHVASASLVDGEDRGPSRGATPEEGSRDAAGALRRGRGSAGLRDRDGFDRCEPVSDSNWNPYRSLPSASGVNCMLESCLGGQTGWAVKEHRDERSHVAVVACGPRLEETLTMLKSAVLLSLKPLHFYIFAEDELHDSFQNVLNSWPRAIQTKFHFTIYPITFPSENGKEWKKLFKPCASQRLFLPLILQEVDSLLYVDTDIIFLQPVEEIWALLSRFNSSQLAAMAPEHEEPRIGWYNRFARHPYYGETGINSGVMLMNLTRLREKHFKNDMTTVLLRWEEMLLPLLQKYKLNITWGDQDLLNIIFHHNPESLHVFPCQWNYRPDHCIYGSNCREAEHEGVFILHGNRGVFHDDKQPAFRAVYEAFHKYQFSEDMETSLLQPLEASLQTTTSTYCGRASHLFTKKLKRSILSFQRDVAQGCPAESRRDSAGVTAEPSPAHRGEPTEQVRRF